MTILLGLGGCQRTPDRLSRPNGAAVLKDGRLVVSDLLHDRLVVFDKDGNYLTTWGSEGLGRGKLWHVTALAADDEGGVWVANRRPFDDLNEDQYYTELKRFVAGEEVVHATLMGTGAADLITGLSVLPSGDLILTNADSTDLVMLNREGSRSGRFGGLPPSDLRPSFLTTHDGVLWVLEQSAQRLRLVHANGDVNEVKLDPYAGTPSFPSSVDVCQDGSWFALTDLGGFKVRRYEMDGTHIERFSPDQIDRDTPLQLLDVDIDADCQRLYITDSKGNRVLITDLRGKIIKEITSW